MTKMPKALLDIINDTRQHLAKQRETILPHLEGPGIFSPKRVVNLALIPHTRNHFTLGYIFGLFMAQVFLNKSLRDNPPTKEMCNSALREVCSGLYGDYVDIPAGDMFRHLQGRPGFWWRIFHLPEVRLFQLGEDHARYQIIKSGLNRDANGVEIAVAAFQTGKTQEFLEHVKVWNAQNRLELGD